MIIKFILEESTVERFFMVDNDGTQDKKEIELRVGDSFEWLSRKTKNTSLWEFEPAFNDLRSSESIIRKFKKAFKENGVKCLEVRVTGRY